MLSLGNRIITEIVRPPQSLIDAFRGIPASNIGDMMNRLFCMDSGIQKLNGASMAGCAVTVNAPEGDNVFLHRALDVAKPGDVIVVNGHGCTTRALMGEIMMIYAQQRGIAGFVIDGAVRDSDAFSSLTIPIYARAVTPQGPYKNGPGEINVPIACGGQVVFPGDLLVGDPDGVCVIPREAAEQVLELAQQKIQQEHRTIQNYRSGILNEEAHKKTYTAVTDRLGTYYDHPV